jgi:hypothetical protein
MTVVLSILMCSFLYIDTNPSDKCDISIFRYQHICSIYYTPYFLYIYRYSYLLIQNFFATYYRAAPNEFDTNIF